ncbi:hypothetical protein XI25_09625 [Paenibacillus sp. DMB20]|nr:hypothetical protein XI25_09625 [Paenibacillus sp. DMB20]
MIKSKALSLTLSAALIASVAGLAGCNTANDGNTTRTNNIGTKNNGRIGGNMVRNNNNNDNGTQQHDLTNMKYSRALSAKISKVKGVRDAHVFVTRNNAYVALALDGQNAGTNNTQNNGMYSTNNGRMNGMAYRGTGTNGRTDGLYGTSGTGTAGLLRGMSDPTGTLDNDTGLGRNAGYGTFGVRGYSNGGFNNNGFDTMGGTTNRTGLMGTNGVNGDRYGMMNNGGNGNLNNVNNVPDDIRQTISSKVRKTVPNCDQVYVSADTDFYNHSAGYANNNNNGNGNRNGNGNGNDNGVIADTVGEATRDFGVFINRLFPLNIGGRNGILNNDGVNRNNRDGNMFDNNDGLFNNRANR